MQQAVTLHYKTITKREPVTPQQVPTAAVGGCVRRVSPRANTSAMSTTTAARTTTTPTNHVASSLALLSRGFRFSVEKRNAQGEAVNN